ncbi:hypothetical protein GCM10007421_30190 [Halopseudomonas oceani]|nr:hypothetical protein GCM10007421_30190 [Halopseudomonas oceani]
MKVVSESLGVARSQLTARLKQPVPGSQPRRRRMLNDTALVEQIKRAVGALPSYGYRRVWGLLRRQHEQQAQPPVNVKRVLGERSPNEATPPDSLPGITQRPQVGWRCGFS